MIKNKYYNFIKLFTIALILLGCHTDTDEKRDRKLAVRLFPQKYPFSIGNNVFSIQMVNLTGSVKFSNASIPCDSNDNPIEHYCNLSYSNIEEIYRKTPRPIPVVGLRIELQGSSLFSEESPKGYEFMKHELCPMLSQAWVKVYCFNFDSFPSTLKGIPTTIYLVHPAHIRASTSSDLVKSLTLSKGKPQKACSKKIAFVANCIAALKISDDLLAVWYIEPEDGMKSIIRDSKAIKAFIEFGISETENYPALKKAIKSIN